MKITVTETSQSLDQILSDAQKLIAKKSANSDNHLGYHQILVQNLGSQDIYVEFGDTATVENGSKLITGAILRFTNFSLKEAEFISDGGDNADIRIILN